jgi:acyl transferase domain-containing protein
VGGERRPRRAGVSSFGISGTNAHIVLEQAPEAGGETPDGDGVAPPPGPFPLVLAAKTEPALRQAAARLASRLRAEPELDPLDVAWSLATTRTAFEHRAVALGEDRAGLLAALADLAAGSTGPDAIVAEARRGKLAFLFTGQGSQRLGMGRELYETFPAFAAGFDAACERLDEELGESLAAIVFGAGEEAAATLEHTAYAQPALFALEVALFELARSRGLKPDLLAGHSIGEVVAAHLAGVLSLADAAKLVVARGRLMGALPEGGAMLAVAAAERDALAYLAGRDGGPAIAAVNSPFSTVLSGSEKEVEAARAHFDASGTKTKRLAVSHAFHSPLMEPMLAEFDEVARGISYAEPRIPIVSGLSGKPLTAAEATDPGYWVRQVREPVRFGDAVAALREEGASAFVELGPDAVLCAMAAESLAGAGPGASAALIPTLRPDRPEPEAFVAALATAHAAGATLDWEAFFGGAGKRVALPTYPFQRERFWLSASAEAGDVSAAGLSDPDHPLLGAALEDPVGGGLSLTGRISLADEPWLADHAVAGTVLLPGAVLLELALRAGEEGGCETIEELVQEAPLILPRRERCRCRYRSPAPTRRVGARSRSTPARRAVPRRRPRPGPATPPVCSRRGPSTGASASTPGRRRVPRRSRCGASRTGPPSWASSSDPPSAACGRPGGAARRSSPRSPWTRMRQPASPCTRRCSPPRPSARTCWARTSTDRPCRPSGAARESPPARRPRCGCASRRPVTNGP